MFLLEVILGAALIQGIGDVQVGNCLTFDQIQGVLEVERTDIYQGGECDKDYGLDGKVSQDLACGLHLDTGEWHRSMVKHKKPGVYWFSEPPCWMSPEFSSYENSTYSEIAQNNDQSNTCTAANAVVFKYQQEKLETKKFEIGQGEAYLPNPLWVHLEKFGANEKGVYQKLSCIEREV